MDPEEQKTAPAQTTSTVSSTVSLPPIETLFSESWLLLKQTWKKLLAFNLVMIAIGFIIVIVLLIVGAVTIGGSLLAMSHGNFSPTALGTLGVGLVVFLVLFIILVVILATVSQGGNMLAVSQPELGIEGIFKKSLHFALPLIGLWLITFFLSVPTLFLFIIPFFFVSFFLYFSPYALVVGNLSVLQSLRRSAYLIKTHFLGMLFRALLMIGLFLVVGILSSILSLFTIHLPFVSFLLTILRTIVNVALGWYMLAYSLTLYKQAEATVPDKTKGVKLIWFVLLSAVSVIFAVVVIGAIVKTVSSNPEIKAVLNSAKSSSESGNTSDVMKQAYGGVFVQSCTQGGASKAICTCMANYLTKNYTVSQLQQMIQDSQQSKQTPKGFTAAATSCVNAK